MRVSVRDLKKAIVEAKKFGRVTDFDLIVSESNTEEVFSQDEDLIHKNISLVVARRPMPPGQKKVWYEAAPSWPVPPTNAANISPAAQFQLTPETMKAAKARKAPDPKPDLRRSSRLTRWEILTIYGS